MRHTPEPWTTEIFQRHDENGIGITNSTKQVVAWLFTASRNAFGNIVRSTMPSEDNATRIVACVNACAGWDKPTAEALELARQTLAYCASAIKHLQDADGESLSASHRKDIAIDLSLAFLGARRALAALGAK